MTSRASHPDGETVTPTRNGSFPWRLTYVLSVFGVAGAVFVLLPESSSLALLVIFAGLMILHHLPGGAHRHGESRLGSGEETGGHVHTSPGVAKEK